MTILPLVERELLVRARSRTGHWTRFAAAMSGILICLPTLMMAQGPFRPGTPTGKFAFSALVGCAFVCCCLAGFLTVDGISRQRREGTLGLLFLTRVRALDVLLGSFGAAGIASLCALMAFVPVLIVPVLAGGVPGGEAFRKAIVLLDTMVLSLSIGLWASALGRGWLACARSAAGLLALLVLGPLVLAWVFPAPTRLGFAWPGPINALNAADESAYKLAASPYWTSVIAIQVMSWLLVAAAAMRLRGALRDEEKASAAPALQPAPKRPPLTADAAPMEWLVRRQRGIKTLVWTAAIVHVAYRSVIYWSLLGWISRGAMRFYSNWGANLAFSVTEDCLFAWAASRFFIEARREGELELLLTTPEGARTLIASQWKWLKEVFQWPILVIMLPEVMYFLSMFIFGWRWRVSPPFSRTFRVVQASYSLYRVSMMIAAIAALVWTGMWYGWSERSQARAVTRSVLLVTGVSYIVNMLGMIVVRQFLVLGHTNALVMLAPSFGQLFFFLWVIRRARRRLGWLNARGGFGWALFAVLYLAAMAFYSE